MPLIQPTVQLQLIQHLNPIQFQQSMCLIHHRNLLMHPQPMRSACLMTSKYSMFPMRLKHSTLSMCLSVLSLHPTLLHPLHPQCRARQQQQLFLRCCFPNEY